MFFLFFLFPIFCKASNNHFSCVASVSDVWVIYRVAVRFPLFPALVQLVGVLTDFFGFLNAARQLRTVHSNYPKQEAGPLENYFLSEGLLSFSVWKIGRRLRWHRGKLMKSFFPLLCLLNVQTL